ncbi:MAG: amidase domain-containing protein [Clostridium paraputrificum]
MLLKRVSKIIVCTIILGSLGMGNIEKSFGLEPSDPVSKNVPKTFNSNLKISEIEDIFQKYLDENNINIKIGTPEYLDYIYNQMLDKQDENLLNHPDYDLITAYFAEYIVAAQGHEASGTKSNMSLNNLENKDKTISQIREEAIAEDEMMKSTVSENSRLAGYSPTKARDYARKWANGANPNYNNYSGNGGDCTNFVSQCIEAGGAKETKPSTVPNGTNGTTKYWYSDKPKVSTPWIRVTDFHSYWAPKVPDANYAGDTTVSRNGNIGDVVQFRHAGTLTRWHSMIITKKDSNQVYLTGHSTNRLDYPISKYDDNAYDWSLLDF